ncbi:phosphatase PAP2 family protein [Chelatococcus reniformis]|uniref:Phosphatase PAP2 family protein n=1 Tax=Chelatococcus reniformis TaxID=1494448 RepID=A0A916USK1_9HYPH|nr:phosphatase PAP2 family protein [Chelatococcus reniformis]GGC84918.1 phosphatase PAP2 family protein [Chelatococcus reniformis]
MSQIPSVRSLASRIGRQEVGALVALLVSAALLLGFVSIANEVAEGETLGFDKAILLALRTPGDVGDPIGPRWFELAVKDLTSLGGTAVLTLITLAAVGYLAMASKRHAALLVLAAIGGGTVLNWALKQIFSRPRPDFVAHVVDASSWSFPSGHAMMSAITYLTLGALLARVEPKRRLKAYLLGLAITLTLLVGASRIYLGVHYPSDILAGWTVGAAWAILCWQTAQWLQRRGEIEGDGADRAEKS